MQTPPEQKNLRFYLTPGQVIGNSYEILDQIGEGGMAIVYRARQKSLNRIVAIKALHPKYAHDASFVERFEAESGALATLSHPNVVTIIDRGAEGEVFYFVMEFVDGEDLDKKIIQNTVRRLADWRTVISACSDALDYIHRRGFVHRDIKPSNVLVSSEGQIKIGDFGIAHILRGDRVEEASPSSSHPLGTTYYMAPEQNSDPATVDHRADIYSLAVAFYKMMTRTLPSGEFPAPSEVNGDIPVPVDSVIFQALAPNREDRYATVKEFCDELLAALKTQNVSISRLFDYRTASSSGSSLYTGVDFRPAAPGQSGEEKKIGGDAASKRSSTTGGRKTGSTSSKFRKKTIEKKLPVKGTSSSPGLETSTATGKQPAIPSTRKAQGGNWKRALLIATILLTLFGGAIFAAMILLGQNESRSPVPSSTPPAETNGSITGARSPALEREQAAKELREQQQAEIIKAEEEARQEQDER